MVLSANGKTTLKTGYGPHDHSFDLRMLQTTRETQWRVRLGAALDIIEEGNLEMVEQCIIPMLSDRSGVVRRAVHRGLIRITGVCYPPSISFYRREFFWLRQKDRQLD